MILSLRVTGALHRMIGAARVIEHQFSLSGAVLLSGLQEPQRGLVRLSPRISPSSLHPGPIVLRDVLEALACTFLTKKML